MDDVLKTVVPLVSGIIIALIGFYAVRQQNFTQRENLKLTMAAQVEQQRAERLAAWRRERYGQLLTAIAEFHAAVRRLNLSLNSGAGRVDQEVQDRIANAARHFLDVNLSSRILEASMQVADKDVAELAHQLADEYYTASAQLVALAITLAEGRADPKAVDHAYQEIKTQIDKSSERRYDLNRRIEMLISEAD